MNPVNSSHLNELNVSSRYTSKQVENETKPFIRWLEAVEKGGLNSVQSKFSALKV